MNLCVGHSKLLVALLILVGVPLPALAERWQLQSRPAAQTNWSLVPSSTAQSTYASWQLLNQPTTSTTAWQGPLPNESATALQPPGSLANTALLPDTQLTTLSKAQLDQIQTAAAASGQPGAQSILEAIAPLQNTPSNPVVLQPEQSHALTQLLQSSPEVTEAWRGDQIALSADQVQTMRQTLVERSPQFLTPEQRLRQVEVAAALDGAKPDGSADISLTAYRAAQSLEESLKQPSFIPVVGLGRSLQIGGIAPITPNISFEIPIGFGGSFGTLALDTFAYSRNRGVRSTGNLFQTFKDVGDAWSTLWVGLGDPQRLLGLSLMYTNLSLTSQNTENNLRETRAFDTGTLGFQLTRQLSSYTSISLTAEHLIKFGKAPDKGTNWTLLGTSIVPLRTDIRKPFSTLYLTYGIGNGEYRSIPELDRTTSFRKFGGGFAVLDPSGGRFYPIGSVALQILPWLNWTTEWNARALDSGFSISLFNNENFNMTVSPLLQDFLGISTDSRSLSFNRFSIYGQINFKFR
jgi:hypothetical protein